MEQSERYVDKLAKYILIAVVVSLIAKPMMNLLRKVRIRGKEGTGLAFGSHIIDHCNRPDNVCHLGHNTYCR